MLLITKVKTYLIRFFLPTKPSKISPFIGLLSVIALAIFITSIDRLWIGYLEYVAEQSHIESLMSRIDSTEIKKVTIDQMVRQREIDKRGYQETNDDERMRQLLQNLFVEASKTSKKKLGDDIYNISKQYQKTHTESYSKFIAEDYIQGKIYHHRIDDVLSIIAINKDNAWVEYCDNSKVKELTLEPYKDSWKIENIIEKSKGEKVSCDNKIEVNPDKLKFAKEYYQDVDIYSYSNNKIFINNNEKYGDIDNLIKSLVRLLEMPMILEGVSKRRRAELLLEEIFSDDLVEIIGDNYKSDPYQHIRNMIGDHVIFLDGKTKNPTIYGCIESDNKKDNIYHRISFEKNGDDYKISSINEIENPNEELKCKPLIFSKETKSQTVFKKGNKKIIFKLGSNPPKEITDLMLRVGEIDSEIFEEKNISRADAEKKYREVYTKKRANEFAEYNISPSGGVIPTEADNLALSPIYDYSVINIKKHKDLYLIASCEESFEMGEPDAKATIDLYKTIIAKENGEWKISDTKVFDKIDWFECKKLN